MTKALYKTVTIPARESHAGLYSRIVTLMWVCPICGGPRGVPFETLSYDGSLRLTVHAWNNPCGHTDMYANVRKEADTMRTDPVPVDVPLIDTGDFDDISLPFDGPVVDTSYDDEADLRRAEYGTHAYDGWDHSDEERIVSMMGAETMIIDARDPREKRIAGLEHTVTTLQDQLSVQTAQIATLQTAIANLARRLNREADFNDFQSSKRDGQGGLF